MDGAEPAGPDGASGASRGGGDRPAAVLELAGLLVLLAALAVVLATRDRLLPFSDPARWYAFGMDFRDSFGSVRLAYLFPLYLAGAIALVGPVSGFLANVPVLVALAAAVWGFARQLARGLGSAPVAGATALALLLAIDPRLLLALSSPYRDPLAHLLLLLASGLLVAFRARPARGALAAASGVCLALACSARETSALALLPFGLYAVASRREQPELPFWRPTLAFAAGFALAILPLLVQNALLSGNPLLPGQSIASVEAEGRIFGGLRWSHFPRNFPRTLGFLAEHYGPLGCALLAAGLLAAATRRIGAALYLALPAAAVYVVLYSCYAHDFPIPRYLFVVDVFALPLAGLGAAALVELAARAVPGPRARRGLAGAALALAAALAASGVWNLRRVEHARPTAFRLAHARALRGDLPALLPRGARVLADFPVGEMLMAFAGDRIDLRGNRAPLRHLEATAVGGEPVYVLGYRDLRAPGEARRAVERRFRLERVLAFDARRWGVALAKHPILFVDHLVPRAADERP